MSADRPSTPTENLVLADVVNQLGALQREVATLQANLAAAQEKVELLEAATEENARLRMLNHALNKRLRSEQGEPIEPAHARGPSSLWRPFGTTRD